MKIPWKKFAWGAYYAYPARKRQGIYGGSIAEPGDLYSAEALDPDDHSKGYIPGRNGELLFDGDRFLVVMGLDALDEQFFHLPPARGEWVKRSDIIHRDGRYWRK